MAERLPGYRNPNPRYHADFGDVTVAPNGDVLLIVRQCGRWAYEATFRFERPLTFFEAKAEMLVLRSSDLGESFSTETTLFSGLAYDPMICCLADGRLMAGMVVGQAGPGRGRAEMEGVLHRHLPQLDTVITLQGMAVWVSEDDGHTWSEPSETVSLPGWENAYNLRKVFGLCDGTLIMPVTIGYPWRSRYVGLIRSWDGGSTWADPSYVAEDPAGRAHYAAGVGYWEPAMAATPEGDMICVCVLDDQGSAPRPAVDSSPGAPVFEPEDALPRLYHTRSVDSGFTWSEPQDSGLRGDFPSMIALPDGRLLLTLTQRGATGSALVAHVSEDGGNTWSSDIALLRSDDELLYYPNSVVLQDGCLLTAFMFGGPDQVRSVDLVRWRLG